MTKRKRLFMTAIVGMCILLFCVSSAMADTVGNLEVTYSALSINAAHGYVTAPSIDFSISRPDDFDYRFSVEVQGDSGNVFSCSPVYTNELVQAKEGPRAFTVTAKTGLAPGVYTATIVVIEAPGTGHEAEGRFSIMLTVTDGGNVLVDGGNNENNVLIVEYEKARIGNCREWVNVRSGPGTEYEIIGRAYLNEKIELLQWNKDETWCDIIYNGGNNRGWVYWTFIIPYK